MRPTRTETTASPTRTSEEDSAGGIKARRYIINEQLKNACFGRTIRFQATLCRPTIESDTSIAVPARPILPEEPTRYGVHSLTPLRPSARTTPPGIGNQSSGQPVRQNDREQDMSSQRLAHLVGGMKAERDGLQDQLQRTLRMMENVENDLAETKSTLTDTHVELASSQTATKETQRALEDSNDALAHRTRMLDIANKGLADTMSPLEATNTALSDKHHGLEISKRSLVALQSEQITQEQL